MYNAFLLFLVAIVVHPAYGQAEPDTRRSSSAPRPARGMVWEAPSLIDRAVRELQHIKRMGVEAVRTDIIRNRELLTHADTLGIDFYVDLPLSRLPAERLRDTLEYATAVLDTVIGLARSHPSVRHIGLATHFDATERTSCEVIGELAQYARRQGPPGTQVYYVTQFVTTDRCAEAVDFVLVDVRDSDDPVEVLRRRVSAGDMGVGALGKWVRPDTMRGLNVPSSPEQQARYFERFLPILLSDTLTFSPRVVFVDRWRDVHRRYPSTARDLNDPNVERYGLHTLEGVERPAYDVVTGFYTNGQTTFAFTSGSLPTGGAPWTTLFGWAVIALLGTFYAVSPRFRHMLPRYFAARFFYRDAVREGRDVLFGASTMLLIAISAAFGLTMSVVVDVLRPTEPFVMAVRWLPDAMQNLVITLLAQPYVLVLLAGCAYAVAIIVWTTVLSLLSTRRYAIAPGQALMLAVWPRWPLLIVMLAAMVIAGMGEVAPLTVLILAAVWIVASALAVVRALIDFILVTRVPIYLLLPALILNPGVIALGVLALVMLPFNPELRFLWNMATNT